MNKHKEISKRNDSENEAASSTTEICNPTASTSKFTIDRKVTGQKIWPKFIKHSVSDSNDIIIPRKYGEGSKPLFARDNVKVNNLKPRQKVHSSSSSSPERYRESDKKYQNQRKDRSFSLDKGKKSKTPDKIPYFADEKREKERLERLENRKKINSTNTSRSFSKDKPKNNKAGDKIPYLVEEKRERERLENLESKKKITYSSKNQDFTHRNFKTRKSSQSYRRSRSSSREYYHRRGYSREMRHHRSSSRSHRRSRSISRSRSRSRDRYRERTQYMPSIYPVVIAAPAAPDYIYGSSNWLQQIFPVPPSIPPPRYPYFMRPISAPFPSIPNLPPLRYPLQITNSRHIYHQSFHSNRNYRFNQVGRGFHRPRNP